MIHAYLLLFLVSFNISGPESKQLTLKKKTVLLFCQQAVSRVEQLKSLEPDPLEGLIATVEHKKV